MCLAIPGQLLSIEGHDELRSGRVRFGGVTKEVNLAYTPEAKVGDYVVVHVGFALSVVDGAEALRMMDNFRHMGAPEEFGRPFQET